MHPFVLINLIIFSSLLVSQAFLMLTKAYHHFNYLKLLYPEKFERYNNYFSLYNSFEFYNTYRFALIFPFLERLNPSHTELEEKLYKKAKLYVKLSLYNAIIFIVYISVLVIFFGQF
jgi:hypothetical protein